MKGQSVDLYSQPWSRWMFYIAATVTVIGYLITSSPIDPLPYTFPSPLPRLEGALRKNFALQNAERWFEGLVVGPESFAVDKNGTIYTGCADGKIFAVRNRTLTLLTRTGEDLIKCGSPEFEHMCGRPKGMKVGSDGMLYVVDSYKGLLRISLESGAIETLVSNNEGSDGVPFRFLNSMDISKDGMIYFTDSSTKWERRDFRYAVLETRPDGRVIQYNPKTGTCRTLLSDLYLANGITLSKNEDFLLISEMSVGRIRRYYLRGENAHTSDIFIDNLPGFPDNIKPNSQGNFYVGTGSVRFDGSSPIGSFLDIIGPYPLVKKIITAVTPLSAYNAFMPKHALVVEVNSEGTIVGSLQDPGAVTIGAASEAYEYNGLILIGHYQSPYLGVITSAAVHTGRDGIN